MIFNALKLVIITIILTLFFFPINLIVNAQNNMPNVQIQETKFDTIPMEVIVNKKMCYLVY